MSDLKETTLAEGSTQASLVGYGTYVPAWRLDRSAIRATLGSGGGKGTRSVAGFDEDATSMAVEAARALLAGSDFGPDTVLLATTAPPYLDKTNATTVHAALDLPTSAAAFDMIGSVRSGTGAHQLAARSSGATLVVASDVRTGLPGGADESGGGDGAAAFAYRSGSGGTALVDVLATSASTAEFLDRWRIPGEAASKQWEERFGETAYIPLAQAAITEALKTAEITADAIDHLVVTGTHARAVKAVRGWVGAPKSAAAPDLVAVLGHLGAAHAGLALADVLDRAAPGEVIVTVTLADGADVSVLRATDALAGYRAGRPTVAEAVAGGRPVDYASFLTWRDVLRREPPRRPDPTPPSGPPSQRNEAWKFSFTASRCEACGTRHLPPQRVCLSCHSVDQMAPEHLADAEATITTFTVDRLAFSLAPPVVSAVLDFDGGGRFQCELTDISPDEVAIGGRVKMTFRRLFTAANGIHDYFWKARLVPSSGSDPAQKGA